MIDRVLAQPRGMVAGGVRIRSQKPVWNEKR
jgi:hypothetical protein